MTSNDWTEAIALHMKPDPNRPGRFSFDGILRVHTGSTMMPFPGEPVYCDCSLQTLVIWSTSSQGKTHLAYDKIVAISFERGEMSGPVSFFQ